MIALWKVRSIMGYSNIGMERLRTMKPPKTGKKRKRGSRPATRHRVHPIPDDYICVAPAEAVQLFDWLNRKGPESDKEIATLHLRLCLHCQEIVAKLMMLGDAANTDALECLHLAQEEAHENLEAHVDEDIKCLQLSSGDASAGSDKENARYMKAGGGGA